MFKKYGYVYTYQMHTHTLINVVSGPPGIPHAILIRAVEPIFGIDEMRRNRGRKMKDIHLTNGPGKLTKAFGITMKYYGHHWSEKPLYISEASSVKEIESSPRIGVLAYFMKKLVSERIVSENTLKLIKECNTFMMMIADENLENKKQHKGNTCKNRFCPICAWKKSRKDALALSVMMAYLKQEEKKEFIFLTLTAPNVLADELNDEIQHYNQSFQRLMQRKEVKTVVKGYARKLEITYNEERDDYHPHFHVLIAVNKSYFTDTKQYINRDRWLELWQQSTKNNLITQVDVRRVRNSKDNKVFEIAKYSAKDTDYLINQEVFEVFYNALKGKRLIVYSGLFKEAMTKFKNGELDEYKEKDMTKYVYAIMYNWGDKKYLELERRLLTDDELEEINGKLINEKDVD